MTNIYKVWIEIEEIGENGDSTGNTVSEPISIGEYDDEDDARRRQLATAFAVDAGSLYGGEYAELARLVRGLRPPEDHGPVGKDHDGPHGHWCCPADDGPTIGQGSPCAICETFLSFHSGDNIADAATDHVYEPKCECARLGMAHAYLHGECDGGWGTK